MQCACITNFQVFLASNYLQNGMQVLKLAKKAAKRKQIKRGVKEVIKAIRKNTKGYVE